MSWTDRAREALLEQRIERSGWGYRPGGQAFVEPTVLASLALLATDSDGEGDAAVREAADWLTRVQQADGSLGPSAELPGPGWGTPYAVLLWAAVGVHSLAQDKATQWLLGLAGATWPPDETGVLGHDTSIPGWPWVQGTHSWLEPTAIAVLALRGQGLADHPRVVDGIRMICDRVVPTGAWNFGSAAIFGTTLHPQPAPTGMALLTLTGSDCDDRLIEGGCRYLHRTLPKVRSPRSLAWGLLGLEAWGQRPEPADAWLADSFSRLDRNSTTPMDPAQLLLASSSRTLDLLEIHAPSRSGV